MASRSYTMDEVKVLKRGEAYFTPMQHHHIDEFLSVISGKNVYELALLGYFNVRDALSEMYESSEAYIIRNKDNKIICVCGLWHAADQEWPQLFGMFSDELSSNFKMVARFTRMIVSFFDQTQDGMTMTILAEFEGIINWMTWLGFEPVGIYEFNNNKYVEFVRCNPKRSNVYNQASRPAKH